MSTTGSTSETTRSPIFNDASYDRVKFLTQVVLPAAGALYFGLANIWNLLYADEIVGTITVIVTFLGTLLQISTSRYRNSDAGTTGFVNVVEDDQRRVMELDVREDLYDVQDGERLVFKVRKH